jgi:type IV pilus assembly protein PilW
MKTSRYGREIGFTLIEVLISMAVGAIVLTALVSTLLIQSASYDMQAQVCEMTQNARAAMDMMTREIRMAGYDPMVVGFNGIPYDTIRLQIVADLNGDGSVSGAHEDITYTYDDKNHQIDRNTGGGAQPFAENIQTFTFDYLDRNGAGAAATADIRQIQVTITARTAKQDPNTGQYRTYTLTSMITPVNLAL